jgi:hypothetical protein
MCLPNTDQRVQKVIATMELTFNEIDNHFALNILLLWPLLSAGCDAASSRQRGFFADGMIQMRAHGVGNCKIALWFRKQSWKHGSKACGMSMLTKLELT